MNNPEPNQIEPLSHVYCHDVARLHREGISTGFVSSLGSPFVTALYEAIADDANSFGFVAVEDGRILGFVAFSSNLSKLYKHVALSKGIRFGWILARRILSFQAMKKIWDNLVYPSKMKKMDLPDAELLSIAVAEEGRGRGIARQLIATGLDECRKRKINKVKVLVAEGNIPANKLYQKAGFQCVCQIFSHGVLSNIYLIMPTNLRNPE